MSRTARIKNRPDENGYYHVICRAIGKEFLFEPEDEKNRLLLWLGKAVEFCGVELQAWCIMSNHVHLMVKVPPRHEVSDAELDRRMQILYMPSRYRAIMEKWDAWRRVDGNEARVNEAKAKLRRRMYDISWFMKTFKQAAAQDYNARHDYSGSIWGGSRFKSVYLEGSLKVLLAVAAYIHLNPVRAKMVVCAEDYEWSSWGQACKQPGKARTGLLAIYKGYVPSKVEVGWEEERAQLEEMQTRVTAKREALEEIMVETEKRKQRKAMRVAPLREKIEPKAPEFSASVALGSAAFIQRFMPQRSPGMQKHRPHLRLLPATAIQRDILCSIGTHSLGRAGVAYTKSA